MENNFDSIYPPKPFLEKEEEKKGYIAVTIFSLLLFILVFLLFFKEHKIFLSQLLIVLIIHELGHFLFMHLFSYRNIRMLFIPLMGAFVHGKKEELKQSEVILVILAGPIPGIIGGIICFLLGIQYPEWVYLRDLGLLSLAINVFNLLPILPLDGGKLVRAIWPGKGEILQLIIVFLASISIVILGFLNGSYITIFFGIFLGIQLRSMHRRYLIHKEVRAEKVVYQISYDALSDRSYHFIKKKVLEHTAALRKIMSMDNGQMEEDMNLMIAEEVKNVLETPMKLNVSVLWKSVVVLVWILSISMPIYLALILSNN